MKIGVIADTHSRPVPPRILKEFKQVDCIVHAGDFCSLKDFQDLSAVKEVKAVSGNMDDPALCKKIPRKIIFEWNGFQIGVFHGEGASAHILDSVQKQFVHDRVDAVIFGHSHQPFNEYRDNVLYFNPGSPNDDVVAPYCSYGFLEIIDGKLVGKIIRI